MSTMPSRSSLAGARRGVLGWYASGHRDFPWRGTRDPYAVAVSEVMLQQTQASRAAQRFGRFMDRFPTVESLASATTASVLAEWNGLGYNRRAVNLQRAAAAVARDGWPRTVDGLARLPGVGPYTARAIASLAFDVPSGVVDTNVRRWLLRRFGGPDTPRRLQALADALAASGKGAEIAAWTHATMEFGATICRSRDPRCDACPIAIGCPSRGTAVAVAVPRQPPMHGSDRAYRGAIVRLLTAVSDHGLDERTLRAALAGEKRRTGPAVDSARWSRLVDDLERDGLAHRSGKMVRLGASTIGR